MEHEELKKCIQDSILSEMDFSRDVDDDEMLERIDRNILKLCRSKGISMDEKLRLRKELFYSIRKLDVLQILVDDPSVTEIMVNGTDNIFVEKDGRLSRYDLKFESKEKLEDVIQQIVSKCNRVVNEASPIADARLENGSRVNIVLGPVALNGPILTIRRFPDNPITMDKLIEIGSIPKELATFLSTLVAAGYNIFIAGGTGSGKTTFLNALSDSIPSDDRVITIEDNAELQILHVPNLVRLETRNANVEGCKEITIRDLIKSSLRMRPTRIIVGEVRGEECVDMLQAMNTGHISMSTGHANSASDMLSRLETMVLMGMDIPLNAIRGQIASGIDIIVQLGRLRDKTRKVLEICELTGKLDERTGDIVMQTLYKFTEVGVDENNKIIGEWRKENDLTNTEKLLSAGLAI
ncbi:MULTISPECIES: CpaF family protein [unclassified Butyrivibrio]|uniref:CpaF family protein n=1 Tax=unclassified Butyrivibrio TaxID=2639466 RepID=UPI000426286F|nr:MULTISPECIES: CpaF family protein [unclassified Butyrivibrio]